MLVWIFEHWLTQDVALFRFITFRTIMAAMTAMAVSLVIGPYFIRQMTRRQYGQPIRELGPESHPRPRPVHRPWAGRYPDRPGDQHLVVVRPGTTAMSGPCCLSPWPSAESVFSTITANSSIATAVGLSARWKYLLQSLAALGCWHVSVFHCRCAGQHLRRTAVLQGRGHSDGPGLYCVDLFRHRRLVQRGQSDRWP